MKKIATPLLIALMLALISTFAKAGSDSPSADDNGMEVVAER